MDLTKEQIESEALKLPSDEREWLADRLIGSLDPDPEWEQSWLVEVTRRIEEMSSGAVAGIPHEEAIARARAALQRQP